MVVIGAIVGNPAMEAMEAMEAMTDIKMMDIKLTAINMEAIQRVAGATQQHRMVKVVLMRLAAIMTIVIRLGVAKDYVDHKMDLSKQIINILLMRNIRNDLLFHSINQQIQAILSSVTVKYEIQ